MAPAAALTTQAEQRPSTGDRTKRKKAVAGIPLQTVLADFAACRRNDRRLRGALARLGLTRTTLVSKSR